jgi:putative chitinase
MEAIISIKELLIKEIADQQIINKNQIAMIMAQCQVESANFTKFEESFAYRQETLLQVFHKYFPTIELCAEAISKGHEFIANTVYANRMGNGSFESGDGWRYRGRGLIQITGQENYASQAIALDLDLLEHPELLLVPENAVRGAVSWLQNREGFMSAAAKGDTSGCTKLINGGFNALPERLFAYNEIRNSMVS